jgi:ketosteroid isomerase-like protein
MGDGPAASARSLVTRYFDMWNTGDVSIADQILSPDWVDHAHPEVAGPNGVRQAVRSIRAARPDLHFHIDAILGDDDLVAVVGAAGRRSQERGSPTRLIWLVRLTDSHMAEMWTYHEQTSR